MKIDMLLILSKDCDRIISVLTTVFEDLLRDEQVDVLSTAYEDLLRGEQVDALTAVYEGLLIGDQADVHIASSCGCGTKHAMLLRYFCCVILARVTGASAASQSR